MKDSYAVINQWFTQNTFQGGDNLFDILFTQYNKYILKENANILLHTVTQIV